MSVVQVKDNAKTSNSVDHAVTLDSTPIEGNLLAAFISHRNTSNCGDVTLSGWTEIECGAQGFVGKGFYKIAGASESATITIDTNSVAASGYMVVIELDDIDTVSPLDDSIFNSDGGEVTSLASLNLNTVADITQCLYFVGVRAGGDDGSFSFTNSFTTQADGEGSGASPSGGGLGYRRVTSADQYASTASWTDAGRAVGIIVSFEEVAAAGLDDLYLINMNKRNMTPLIQM